eukprot:5897849-Amphidinium_carterae.2
MQCGPLDARHGDNGASLGPCCISTPARNGHTTADQSNVRHHHVHAASCARRVSKVNIPSSEC